ncbi:MAG: hypothetical protein IVW36_08565 [Dehalococcoidia bacterium]|nr:hypothetical protein [Dehalococcoidia bacterium]
MKWQTEATLAAGHELAIDPLFDALRAPLALVDDDARRRAIETYLDAARLPLERAAYDLLSEVVRTIDERVAAHYRLRLAYRPGGLALEVEEKAANGGGDESVAWAAEGDVEKITIRIPAELKDLATQAAQRAGTSANSWFIKALARSLRNMEAASPPPGWRGEQAHGRHRGAKFTGWVGGDDDRE